MNTKMDTGVKPIEAIKDLKAYQSEPISNQIRLKLDANEGPSIDFDWSSVKDSSLCRYPDRSGLERKLAERFGTSADQVLVTAGGDDAIDRVCRAFLCDDRNIVFPHPSFEMIRNYSLMTGSEVRFVEWEQEFPYESVLQNVDSNTSVLAVVSPNNPTGNTVSADSLRQMARELPNVLLLVDQAYAEFEDVRANDSLTHVVLNEIANGIVIRSFSKAWGLAGLRVGYALGSAVLIETLKRVGGPYSVSALSLAIVEDLLNKKPEGNVEYIERVKQERESLSKQLTRLNLTVAPSQGNFVYVDFSESKFDSQFVYSALVAQGILVRRIKSKNAIRITCPGEADAFQTLSNTLERILNPQAIIFDMDGVLVDENPSYREAIRLTCQSFGKEVTVEEIANQKLCGDANNDWIFTQRLLQSLGCDLEFETVKQRFEQIYQGDDTTPGVWDREVRLVDQQWLADLASRYPLAIVTGRPRNDAERFLRNENLEQYFTAIVCMEDGPRKPDPANVNSAMQQLGVERIWMIGDTPDDIGAARSAGQVAIGIVAPADEAEFATQKLQEAAATTIVNNLQEFEALLP